MRKAGFKDKDLHVLLWKAAKYSTVYDFNMAMSELTKANIV